MAFLAFNCMVSVTLAKVKGLPCGSDWPPWLSRHGLFQGAESRVITIMKVAISVYYVQALCTHFVIFLS